MIVKEQLKAALTIVQALAEAIRSLRSIPSGHLYAQVCGHLSLDEYNFAIATLVRAGLVRNDNHLLTWIGEELVNRGTL